MLFDMLMSTTVVLTLLWACCDIAMIFELNSDNECHLALIEALVIQTYVIPSL